MILAAGLGSRISNRSKIHPKGFIEVGGSTLIERSIRLLKKNGIQRILIATGHESIWYERLAESTSGIQCIKNPDYAKSGSLHSLDLLASSIDSDFLLLESDLIYEERALTSLLELDHEALLVSGVTSSGDEVYVEADSHNNLRFLSKNPAQVKKTAGELVGISRLSLATYRILHEWVSRLSPQPSLIHYEEGLYQIYSQVKIPLLKVENLVWAEVDTETHLTRVKQSILPQIEKRSSPGLH